MSNFVGWWDLGRGQRSAVISQRVCTALKPMAVDGLTSRSMDSVTFMHARFDTVPEAAHEHQPIVSLDGRLMITASARLDNLAELRRALPRDLPAHTDAHAVLAGYQLWGSDVVYRLRGDFSFLIWDSARQRLFGARDHLGICPLYVAHTASALVAGTCLAAMVAHPDISRDPDEAYLAEMLTSTIWSTTKSPFRAITRLDAGQRFSASLPDAQPAVSTYWTPRLASQLRVATPEDEAETRRLIDESVLTRCRTIGPLGSELSGGLDSSLVTAIAATNGTSAGAPIAITYAMPGSPLDETPLARSVVEHFGLEHVVVECRPQESDPLHSARLTQILGAPLQTARSQAELDLETWAQSAGCRVMLSGHGGDELFDERFPQLVRALRHPRRDSFSALGARHYGGHGWQKKFIRELLVPAIPPAIARPIRRLLARIQPERNAFGAVLQSTPHRPRVPLRKAATSGWSEAWLSGWWQLSLDQDHVLGPVSRFELRYPLMDVRLVEHVSSLWFPQSGPNAPYREAQRRISNPHLPAAVTSRDAKHDYTSALLIRAVRWDRDLMSFEQLASLGVVKADELRRFTTRILDGDPTARSWEIRLAVSSLATELWLRDVVRAKR